MGPRVIFSTSSVFPQTDLGFRLAAEYGYDGVELMVTHERKSQTPSSVADMVQRYQMPVTAVHVPCLVITQPVWTFNPIVKLERSVEMALQVGAETVVVHPPFRWQRDHEAPFRQRVLELHEQHAGQVDIAVENMYSVEKFGRSIDPYLWGNDPGLVDFPSLCLDTSHAAAARWDPIELYRLMGDRVRHVHLSDSTSTRSDEHLPPGMGTLPLRELAQLMLEDQFTGDIVLEVATSKLPERSRRRVTEECLRWTREAFADSRAN